MVTVLEQFGKYVYTKLDSWNCTNSGGSYCGFFFYTGIDISFLPVYVFCLGSTPGVGQQNTYETVFADEIRAPRSVGYVAGNSGKLNAGV